MTKTIHLTESELNDIKHNARNSGMDEAIKHKIPSPETLKLINKMSITIAGLESTVKTLTKMLESHANIIIGMQVTQGKLETTVKLLSEGAEKFVTKDSWLPVKTIVFGACSIIGTVVIMKMLGE